MKFQEHSKKLLKKAGYRFTKARKLTLDVLGKSKKPLNPYQIADLIEKKNEHVDTVTVYRILEVFEKMKIAHKIGKSYVACSAFNCSNQDHCHHQFICDNCDNVSEIHVDDRSFINNLNKLYPQLSINSHNFQFSGLCKSCNPQ